MGCCMFHECEIAIRPPQWVAVGGSLLVDGSKNWRFSQIHHSGGGLQWQLQWQLQSANEEEGTVQTSQTVPQRKEH